MASNLVISLPFRQSREKLLYCDIEGNPHIESKIKQTMKKNHAMAYDLLNGPASSGFGYDSQTKMVVAADDVWNAYCKV